jgi:site-specific recombinase XerD
MGVFIREKKNRHLYLDYRQNGHRHTESLHLTLTSDEKANRDIRRLAEAIRVKKMIQLASLDHGLLDPVEGKRSLVLYAEALAAKQAPKNPLPKSIRYLREFAGNIQLQAVTEKWVDDYREFLLTQEAIGHSTASKYLEALKTVFRHAVRDSILPRNPSESVKGISAPESIKVYLTPDEISCLAGAPLGGELGNEVKHAFLFGCLTGLRISDLKSLSWGDVVRGDPWQVLKRQNKTNKTVSIPLNDAAVRIIDISPESARTPTARIFPKLSASLTNTNQYLQSWASSAGIKKSIGWHTARHTFGTLTLEGGADLATVSRLLGHTKLATTLIYAKSTDRAKRKAVDSLPDVVIEEQEEKHDR